MWDRLEHMKKFTPREVLEGIVGPSLFQIEDRPAYYHGGGIVVYYAPRAFRVEGIQRVEHGPHELYFYGRSKRTKLSVSRFVFHE